jgi:CHAT domain-containing protein
LLVGGPDYGAPSSGGFDPLPGAEREVDRIDETWQRHHPDLDAPVRLTGAAATESAFKEHAPGHTVLHLATHGYLLEGDADADFAVRNPLLRSGLAFAGANAGAGTGDDDGILTAEELAALDLSRAEWAVLSACDTGLGEIGERGEGVFGLARALQIAGARTVIMSLWAVDDEATQDWMLSLYEARLVDRLGSADAVRQASIRTIRSRREAGLSDHPFYWAAFVSSGDWR